MARLATLPSVGRDDVSVLIGGREFKFWSTIDITRSLDSVSTITLTAPFDPTEAEFREAIRPFTFKRMEVLLGGKPLFTGTMVAVNPESTPDSTTITVEGYSLPGVLGDCHLPASSVPKEFKKLPLSEILPAIVQPFGLDVDIREDTGAPFKKVALDIDGFPIEFLSKLAAQRNLVLSSNNAGALLCWRSVSTGSPVASLEDRPISKVSPSFSAQDYFSTVTGFVPAKRKKIASKATVENPFLPDVLRPRNIRLRDVESGDANEATEVQLSRMFASMASYTVSDIPTWRDPQGDLWAPNTIILIKAPDAMVYDFYEFLIPTVDLHLTHEEETAALGLVLPGAFDGTVPRSLPWDG